MQWSAQWRPLHTDPTTDDRLARPISARQCRRALSLTCCVCAWSVKYSRSTGRISGRTCAWCSTAVSQWLSVSSSGSSMSRRQTPLRRSSTASSADFNCGSSSSAMSSCLLARQVCSLCRGTRRMHVFRHHEHSQCTAYACCTWHVFLNVHIADILRLFGPGRQNFNTWDLSSVYIRL